MGGKLKEDGEDRQEAAARPDRQEKKVLPQEHRRQNH